MAFTPASHSMHPISLSAIAIGLLSLVTILGVRLRKGLQPVTIPASSAGFDLPMNTSSALGDNVMEMRSQDPNVNDEARVGWGQLSSQNSYPLTPCYVHRPQLKAAKKANRLRPKKKMLSDINRKPPAYNVEPQFYEGRPDEYAVETEGSDDFDKNAHIVKVLAALEAQADYDNTDAAEEEKIMASIKYPDPAQATVAMAAVLETRPAHKVKSRKLGWGQLSSMNSRPFTSCYAKGRETSSLNVMKRRRKRLANQDRGRMRLNVFRSNNHIYAQVIDDKEGNTLCAASTLDKDLKSENPKGNDQAAAGRVGALLAERAKAKGLEALYFDRFSNSGNHKYLFHGRVKALVDGVREGGIKV